MSYAAAIENLSALMPELFHTAGAPRRKFSLTEIGTLCAALGDPQSRFPSVLIAGTNGKGSTASTLASIARESGLRVGLYTSPHLDRVNERIRLGEPAQPDQLGAPGLASETWASLQDISDDDFARFYFRVHDTAQQLVLEAKLPAFPSYFELLTALAFLYFAESKVDLAILEVGMGGRLDATNIVDPILSVITDISLDHQEWLGATIDLIAREKAGILRPNGTLVTLPQHPEANQALGEVAVELNVRGISAADYMPQIGTNPVAPYAIEVLGKQILVDSPLKGAHQHRNIALAIAAAVELRHARNIPITPETIQRGIATTSWPGRLEKLTLPNPPEFLLDVAHNPAGAWALRAALSANQPERSGAPHLASEMWEGSQVLIFACLRDKPLREMTQILFPIFDHVILAPIHSPRATEVADLQAAAEATGVPSTPSSTVEEALQLALQLNPARVVISGSVYLVGEARHLLLASRITQFKQEGSRQDPAP
ncbi:bifunctional folylpolyglutamate synthase/dihydrofolate synthase [Acidicapsa acidisoli]|uniref:bifunctional folylpolyglutamate synthase/dihydrofolate synthase n=1 Tax=Acidicapsa acidisoli TaxID=1615681 RepID=UPI0021E08CDD|nr:folylpolyglutamate synthase/dihydrofolate synthase family protein [Acidicapsa acidisoli]